MKKNKYKEMTIMEASNFFDEHDIFEFSDVAEVKDIKFRLHKKKYIGLDIALFEKIQNIAKKQHTDEDTLIQKWLIEKVS